MESRNALVDLSNLALVDAEIISYLEPSSELVPALVAAKPDPIDPFDDVSIDTAKWATTGTITEQTFLGVDGLTITGPATPGYDAAGVIYKPAILASTGKLVLARCIMDHPVEYVLCLQEYAFTVDSIVTPTSWTLKHLVAQDLRNSMGVRVAPGALYFFEGGNAGVEEFVMSLPSKPSKVGEVRPIQIGFIFTASGFDIYAHLPGIWTQPVLAKQYTRPGGSHSSSGYSLCVNAYTADNDLHFYDPAYNFKSNAMITGGRIVVANLNDQVVISSLLPTQRIGFNMGKTGSINVMIPDYSSSLLTLDQIAQVTAKLSGKRVYPIEFELNGDAALAHPVRIVVEDTGLPLVLAVSGE